MTRLLAFLFACYMLLASGALAADKPDLGESEIPKSIHQFVEKPEPAYGWSLKGTDAKETGRIHRLHLVSQTWQGITWEHALYVYEPSRIDHPEHALLFVSGGTNGKTPGEKDQAFGLKLASACGAPVAVLSQVPNQPLLDNRKEDDLITETWLRYLKTGDETWPLLFPMVKSAVKAMDALEEFSKDALPGRVKSFVITGASKRGWTSWLTPVVDRRIVGTAPIVIDMLNFPAQSQYQKATWGKYSEQIVDYTSKGLVKAVTEEETPREKRLRLMMDPFTYRRQLELPKLMIVGTNDRYWVVDAMNLYWDDLAGPKYVLQVPNAGHDLGEGREHALNTLAVFFRHVASKQPLPEIRWQTNHQNGELSLSVESKPAPTSVRLWSATAGGNDFRESKWKSEPLNVGNPGATGSVKLPDAGRHVAIFAELEFRYKDRPYSLTTLVYRK